MPTSEKQSGEQSWTFGAYFSKLKTNRIARSLIIMYHFPYNSKISSSPFEHLYFFWGGFLWLLLGYTFAKPPTSLRSLTWFTRPFLLVRWGLGTNIALILTNHVKIYGHSCTSTSPFCLFQLVMQVERCILELLLLNRKAFMYPKVCIVCIYTYVWHFLQMLNLS